MQTKRPDGRPTETSAQTAASSPNSSARRADGRADNLADCFNFSQSPLKFKPIEAPLKADYFINDRRVPEDPDTD